MPKGCPEHPNREPSDALTDIQPRPSKRSLRPLTPMSRVDEASGPPITITLWDAEEAMLASEPTAQRLRDEDMDSGLAGEQPVVERYKSAVREIV